ncbi:MAG: hypothetical protein GY694_22540, partial [Gammaproteobacteria bacterium]|nr:hypothetical protein [Gammaproteobacteria bacterium]
MNKQKKKNMPSGLAISTAAVTAMLTGYSGRNAYAGDCATNPGPGTYTCSGAANSGTDTTQTRSPGIPLNVTTTPGFGIDTAAGDALELEGDGGLIFIDNYASTIKTRGGSSSDQGI